MRPGYREAQHHALIAQALEAVERRDLRYLAITMPPRHGKSELASVHFPPWYVGRNPDHWVQAVSYGADLSYTFSRRARAVVLDERYPFDIKPAADMAQVKSWAIQGHLGGYRAVGMRGALTGMGANVLLIDDPVKSREEADSETIREQNWEWFRGTAVPRLEPDGAIVLIGTRWREDDLIGRALTDPDFSFHHLSLPALADPAPGEPDALGREAGDPLWPERFSVEELLNTKQQVGPRNWDAQYQQRPSPAEGGTFHAAWWNRYNPHAAPRMADAAIFVDSAFKEGVKNDYSVFAVWGTPGDGRYYVLDVWRNRVEFPELIQAGYDVWAKWAAILGRGLPLVVEDKASGQSAIQVWRRPGMRQDGTVRPALPVIPHPVPSGESKESRAEGVSHLVESGLVFLPDQAPWVADFVSEHNRHPLAEHDDQVDTTAMALVRLSRRKNRGGTVV